MEECKLAAHAAAQDNAANCPEARVESRPLLQDLDLIPALRLVHPDRLGQVAELLRICTGLTSLVTVFTILSRLSLLFGQQCCMQHRELHERTHPSGIPRGTFPWRFWVSSLTCWSFSATCGQLSEWSTLSSQLWAVPLSARSGTLLRFLLQEEHVISGKGISPAKKRTSSSLIFNDEGIRQFLRRTRNGAQSRKTVVCVCVC